MGGMSKTSQQETKINEKLSKASEPLIKYSQDIAKMPYTPNRGVTVADFSPMQKAAFNNTDAMSNAFGLQGSGGGTGLPQATDAGNGVMGFGTGGIFDQNVAASMTPAQANKFKHFFNPSKR